METTRRNLPWAERTTVKKGDLGESIVDEFLRGKRVIPYKPTFGGAHPFDRLCATADKKTIFIADVKTKPARLRFPDTGINIRHYDDYKFIAKKYGLRIFIFFVDEVAQEVYGNWLEKLEAPASVKHRGETLEYPMRDRGIIYFPRSSMERIAAIELEQAKRLMELSTRNEKYVYG